ncbi:MAG: molybdopterin molybdotransferase MoeA [Lachnospiraceae bacterium]|nr:molybdopterin molybdotransferase MoeA [Lachnospiraceae bacterium]
MSAMGYKEAEKLLLENIKPVGTETVSTEDLFSRIPAEDLAADQDVPHFDRSPYDGYAFMAEDTIDASESNPVTLQVIENIRAGQTAEKEVVSGTAVRLMTGAPLPAGADAICMYEDTDFTDDSVSLKHPYSAGDNIIWHGEDIKKGTLLVKRGTIVDAAVMGIVSSLGMSGMPVYKKPVAGVISTGDELVDINQELKPGKIRNSNKYILFGALKSIGIDTAYIGHASDDIRDIYDKIIAAEKISDIIISTGGVSAGDYDLVPDAMQEAGYEIIVKGIDMKPGMACAFGVKDGRIMLALSGNPASALTNLQCVCYPALKKLAGLADHDHTCIKMRLKNDFTKSRKGMRFVRGVLSIEEGAAVFAAPEKQGNIVISSAALCNAYACLPKGKEPLKAGDVVDGFIVNGRY